MERRLRNYIDEVAEKITRLIEMPAEQSGVDVPAERNNLLVQISIYQQERLINLIAIVALCMGTLISLVAYLMTQVLAIIIVAAITLVAAILLIRHYLALRYGLLTLYEMYDQLGINEK